MIKQTQFGRCTDEASLRNTKMLPAGETEVVPQIVEVNQKEYKYVKASWVEHFFLSPLRCGVDAEGKRLTCGMHRVEPSRNIRHL